MRSDPEAVIQGLYAAWTLQDVETTLAYCHDDVRYEVVTASTHSHRADLAGKAQVRAHLEAMCAVWEWHPAWIQPGPFVVEGDVVIREQFAFRARHRRSGLEMNGTRRHVWTVKKGRVSLCSEQLDTATLDAFLRMADAYSRSAAEIILLLTYSGLFAGLAGLA